MDFNSLHQASLDHWNSLTRSEIPVIYLGTASCGRAAGAMEVLQAIRSALAALNVPARVVEVGCIGPCYLEPLMDVALPGKPRISYANVTPQRALKILTACLKEGDVLPKWAAGHFGDAEFTQQTGIPRFWDLPMLKPQVRIVLKNCGLIDPERIEEYLEVGGYQALKKMPDPVIMVAAEREYVLEPETEGHSCVGVYTAGDQYDRVEKDEHVEERCQGKSTVGQNQDRSYEQYRRHLHEPCASIIGADGRSDQQNADHNTKNDKITFSRHDLFSFGSSIARSDQ